MAGIDHAPPPFFKRGPAPLALLTFYIAVSLAIFVLDLRFRSLDLLRQSIALVVDPVQRVAQTPGSLVDYAASTAFNLVETLAERCAALVLEEFGADGVRLKLSKPGAVQAASTVGVAIERGNFA